MWVRGSTITLRRTKPGKPPQTPTQETAAPRYSECSHRWSEEIDCLWRFTRSSGITEGFLSVKQVQRSMAPCLANWERLYPLAALCYGGIGVRRTPGRPKPRLVRNRELRCPLM